MYKFDREAYDRRMEWYRDARFGMFIHWGLYAIPARGEWVRSTEQIPKEDYMKYFEEFNPVDFEPRKWAKAAKEAGMKYVVLTAKHHDGFCLFDSQYTDFKSTNTKCGRDLVAEYVDAVRAEGLKVGLYFSLLDWFHDDFPHYGDRNHPMRNNPAYKNDDRDFDRYLTYMHNQVGEICTNYGKLDVLWFDFSYDTLRGEAWKATELINMVRKLQPDVIIDNRLEVSGEVQNREIPKSDNRAENGGVRIAPCSQPVNITFGIRLLHTPNTALPCFTRQIQVQIRKFLFPRRFTILFQSSEHRSIPHIMPI